MLVQRDETFFGGVVNLPLICALQNYFKPFLSLIGAETCRTLKMLESMVQAGL